MSPYPGQWDIKKEEGERSQKVIRMSIGPLISRITDSLRRSKAGHEMTIAAAAVAAEQGASRGGGESHRQLLAAAAPGVQGKDRLGNRKLGRGYDSILSSSSANPLAPPRMVIFSGHDSTLSPLLSALGKPGGSWPPFTSSLVFELWRHRVSEDDKQQQHLASDVGTATADGEGERSEMLRKGKRSRSGSRRLSASPSGAVSKVGDGMDGVRDAGLRYDVRVLWNRQPLEVAAGHPGERARGGEGGGHPLEVLEEKGWAGARQ